MSKSQWTAEKVFSSSTAQTECDVLLEYLMLVGPISTTDIQHKLWIKYPAARIHELRHKYRYDIEMKRIHWVDEKGKWQREGEYRLKILKKNNSDEEEI
jgi:hypothetical protein